MFLDFPAKVYSDGDCPQDLCCEKKILSGRHVISCDVEVFPYIVLDATGEVACRCVLSYYYNDPVAYVGFFEAYNNVFAVREMFAKIENKAKKDGKTKIIGPVDVSIYINYRFKVDRFDKTYTGEPYNKDYYVELWKEAGYEVCDKYSSNQLRKIESGDIDERLNKIYDRYLDRDFDFFSPTPGTFKDCLEQVYELMMKMYSGFFGFKLLTKEQFVGLYTPLQKVMDFDMVRLVYNKNHKLCAFCICLPNYGGLTRGKLTFKKVFKIKKIKEKPMEYVILYLGADTSSAGLGGALVHDIRNILYRKGCTSIGALIKEGNVSGKMYEDLYVDKFNYVLLEKRLSFEEYGYGYVNCK